MACCQVPGALLVLSGHQKSPVTASEIEIHARSYYGVSISLFLMCM